MGTHKFKKLHYFLGTLLIGYILLQPFLDVSAFLGLPVSTIIRAAIIPIGILFILTMPHTKWKTAAVFYIAFLAIVMAGHLLNNIIVKDPISLGAEINHIIKTIYFPILLIVYAMLFYSMTALWDFRTKLVKYIVINTAVTAVIIVAAHITGTAKRSYHNVLRDGHTGWFFSGNELSVILAVGFCFVMLSFLVIRANRLKWLMLPGMLLIIWSMLNVGTKVALGAAVLTLLLGIVVSFLEKRKTGYSFHFTGIVLLTIITAAVTPFTPVITNMGVPLVGNEPSEEQTEQEAADNESVEVEEEEAEGQEAEAEPDESTESGASQSFLFSGREAVLDQTIEQYKEAPISQKILGMGRGGNYTSYSRFIEMDFIDWFFTFGIAGFSILVLPIFLLGAGTVMYILKKRLLMRPEVLFSGLAVLLGAGSAFTAGHVLSSPGAGIYLLLALAYVFCFSAFYSTSLYKSRVK